jgi:hypothetical protein
MTKDRKRFKEDHPRGPPMKRGVSTSISFFSGDEPVFMLIKQQPGRLYPVSSSKLSFSTSDFRLTMLPIVLLLALSGAVVTAKGPGGWLYTSKHF